MLSRTNYCTARSPSCRGEADSRLTSSQLAGPPAPVPGWTGAPEPGLFQLVNVLLKRWKLVTGLPVALAVVTVGVATLLAPTFTATTTFVPESPAQAQLPAGLAGLAGQLGVSIGPEGSRSPRFYSELVRSRGMLERVVLTRYSFPRTVAGPTDSASLLVILRTGGRSYQDSVERGVRALQRMISVSADNETNIVRVSVLSRYPDLAAPIANRIVEYLNDFNTRHRQTQARQRRSFVEQRLAEVEDSLRRAEQQLRTFYERNRSWEQAPQLRFEEGRLRRLLEIRQEVYLTLAREYETARIEEVNDTPVLTVLDSAVPPQRRSQARRSALAVVAMAFGLMFSVVLAIGIEYLDHMRRENRGEYLEFRRLVRQMRSDLGGLAKGSSARAGSPTGPRSSP